MQSDFKNVTAELSALGRMNMPALRAKYEEAFGQTTGSHNAAFLRKKIAWRIQERAEGGLSERVLARIAQLQQSSPLRERPRSGDGAAAAVVPAVAPDAVARAARDPALPPPGTVLRRIYQGRAHEVTVTPGGFTYRGQSYSSLSAIAKIITGTTWNGKLFFALTTRKRKEAS
jgi:hypothetical protein